MERADIHSEPVGKRVHDFDEGEDEKKNNAARSFS